MRGYMVGAGMGDYMVGVAAAGCNPHVHTWHSMRVTSFCYYDVRIISIISQLESD